MMGKTKNTNFEGFVRAYFNIKHIAVIVFFSLLLPLFMLLFSNEISSIQNYSSFLNTRHCNYSVLINQPLSKNSYAYYGDKISFSKDQTLSSVLDATVWMETFSVYDEDDFFNGYDVHTLGRGEIVVSENLNIKIGTTLYTKSKRNGKLIPYKVTRVLPAFLGLEKENLRVEHGLILLGKDKEYLQKRKTNYLYFFDEDSSDINKEGANISGSLYDFSDVEKKLILKHSTYSGISVLLLLGISLAEMITLSVFNSHIYQEQRKFGNGFLYKNMLLNLLVYSFITRMISFSCYGSVSHLFSLSLEELLRLIFSQLVVACLVYLVHRKWLRRK